MSLAADAVALREGLITPRNVIFAAALFVALLTMSYGAPLVLIGLLAVPAFVLFVVRPRLATVVTIFVLYTNLPAVVARHFGLPVALAASGVLLLGIPLAHHLILRRERLVMDRTFGFMLLLLVVMASSATFARAPELAAARVGLYVLEGLALYWLIVNIVRDLAGLRRVIWTLLIACSLLSALGLQQAVRNTFGREYWGLAHRETEVLELPELGEEAVEVRMSKRAQGPVDDANRFAQLLIVVLPLALYAFRATRRRTVKLAATLCGLLVLSGVLLTYSRGAFLVLVLLVALAMCIRWLRPIYVMVGVAACVLTLPYIAPTYYERIASIASARDLMENRFEAQTDNAIRGRTTEMLAAMHAFMDHPLLGVGPGNYAAVYSVDYMNRHETSFRNLQRPRRAHSLYLEMAAEMGAVGLVVFLSMVGFLLWELWRARPRRGREPDELSQLSVALAFALLGYLGTGVFLHLSFERYFWMLLALASIGVHVTRRGRLRAAAAAPAGPAFGPTPAPAPAAGPLWSPVWPKRLPAPVRARAQESGGYASTLERLWARSARTPKAGDQAVTGPSGPRKGGMAAAMSDAAGALPAGFEPHPARPSGAVRSTTRGPRAHASRPPAGLPQRIMATVRAGVVPLLRAVGRVSVWIGLVVFHAVQRLSQVVMAIAWRVAKPRVERLRTRYWFNLLDAVVTSSVLPVQGASLRRVFTPLRQANFKRLQHAVVALEARWPSLAQRLRDSVMRDDLLPFAAFLDPRPFAHGWNSTVYRLRLRDSTDLEGPEAVLKVVRNSLGRATPQLLEQVRVARSRYEKLTRWYGEAMLPRTRFFVLQAPLLGAPAIAILQPRLPGQPKDLFALEDDEILRLVARHVELRGQFRHFVARTIESVEQTSLCPDLMGRRNVLVVESLQGPRLSIVDTGLKDLAQLERERPDIVRQVRIRLARLERLRDAMDRAARDRSGIDGIGHAKFLPDAENERERAALRVMPAAARRLIVLTYHRVLDAGEQGLFNPSLVSTTPSMFEWQMRKVARDYRVVSLHDVLEAFRGGRPLPTRAVLITFDDGYRDFGEVAWPILRRLGLPAALFVPTGYPDRPDRRFWWDRLAAAFQRADPRALSALLGGSTIVYWPEGWRRALRDVVAQLKSLPHAQAMMVVESVLSRLGEQKLSPRSSVLGWSELRELAREGVSMCPHSRNHAALTRLPLSAARAEVRDSVEDLRREIGSAPPAFAYPFGDHDPTIVELLRQEGIEVAFSIREGHNDVPGTDPLRLRRTNVAPNAAHLLPLRLRRMGERFDRWRDQRRRGGSDGVRIEEHIPPAATGIRSVLASAGAPETTSASSAPTVAGIPLATSATGSTAANPASANGSTAGAAPPAREASPTAATNGGGASDPRPVVAYLMSRFPKLTETFVLYEIAALDAMGVPVEVYPLLREKQKVVHPEAEAWVRRAHFLPFLSLDILRAQAHYLTRKPLSYTGLLFELVRRNWGSRNFLLGSLGIFPKCVRFAYEMELRGVSHVHAHFANHPAAAAFIIHRLTGIPYSFTAHGSDLHVERRMLDAKVRDAAFAVTVSKYNREVMLRECGEAARDKIHVVHCGVDPEVFSGTSEQRGLKKGPLSLACVASFEEVKGHATLVDALKILSDRGVRFRCHLVGTGPLEAKVKAAVARAGLENRVFFHGGLGRPQVARLLALVDAAVLASQPTRQGKREGIPVALMEAMCAGLPVVASNLSGIPELVVSGKTGLLVPPADPLALANALHRLADDPVLRTRLGNAAKLKVQDEFDLRKNAAKLLELVLGSARDAAAVASKKPSSARRRDIDSKPSSRAKQSDPPRSDELPDQPGARP